MAHKHAHAMALYAQDALEMNEPFRNWEFRVILVGHEISYSETEWADMPSHPSWNIDCEYRRKPNQVVIDEQAYKEFSSDYSSFSIIRGEDVWKAALEWERSKK